MKMIGHGLSSSLKDIMAGEMTTGRVLQIESNAFLPDERQLRNFVSSTVSTRRVDEAFEVALSFWSVGRLIHNPKADRLASKHGTWRKATAEEAGRNKPDGRVMCKTAV